MQLERLLGRILACGASGQDVDQLREALGLGPSPVTSPRFLNEGVESFLRHEYPSGGGISIVAQPQPRQGLSPPLRGDIRAHSNSSSSAERTPSSPGEIDSWFFDIFEYNRAVVDPEVGVLVEMGKTLLARHHLISKFGLSEVTLVSYLSELQAKYNDHLPYHNSLHAADVAQSLSSMLVTCGLGRRGDDLLRFASIIAALGHDVGHPGLTSRYLIETRHALTLRYNDKSPLENMHASVVFTTMWTKPGRDIIFHLPKSQQNRFRRLVINMILATDNADHERVLRGLQSNDDERVFEAALHAADLGGTGKTPGLALNWTERVLKEFHHQGDLERAQGLNVIPVNDRYARQPRGVFQEGFITAIVLPLYRALHVVPELNMAVQIEALEGNVRFWVGGTVGNRPRLKTSKSFHAGAGGKNVSEGGGGSGEGGLVGGSNSSRNELSLVAKMALARRSVSQGWEARYYDTLNLSPRAKSTTSSGKFADAEEDFEADTADDDDDDFDDDFDDDAGDMYINNGPAAVMTATQAGKKKKTKKGEVRRAHSMGDERLGRFEQGGQLVSDVALEAAVRAQRRQKWRTEAQREQRRAME
jgi:hypothetical protein